MASLSLPILFLSILTPISSLDKFPWSFGTSYRFNRARILEDEAFWNHRQFDKDETRDGPDVIEEQMTGHIDPAMVDNMIDGEKLIRRSGSLPLDLSLPDNDGHTFSPSRRHAPKVPKSQLRSTGTTIAGVQIKDYVVLGADTRSTDGTIVADNRCEKIHYLAPLIYACGAGTAGDLDMVTRVFRYQLEMERVKEESIGNDGPSSDVPSGFAYLCKMLKTTLYENQGDLGVNLVMGGIENGRPHLVAIHPHGSMDVVPFVALGSGGLAAMAVLEARYRTDMTLAEAKKVVADAIQAGIQNDLGSGSQVDLCVIGVDGSCDYTRAVVAETELDVSQAKEDEGGVNGFGNLPYEVESTMMLLPASDDVKKSALDTLLGFD